MHRLYALQQRLAITSAETMAFLFVTVLLLAGFCVRYMQGQSVPFSSTYYAELDRAFDAQTPGHKADEAGADSSRADEGGTPEARPVAVAPQRTARRTVTAGPVRMNVNTASEQMLQRLPGIGPKMAARITEYRALHGDFARPRDLVRVKGIGPKTYEKLAPYLYVDEPQEAVPQEALPQVTGVADGS